MSKTLFAELPSAETICPQQILDSFRKGEIDLICVLGPTASGKTRFAVNLAKEIGGEIISADSRQVYRGMDIGTGKDLDEYGDIPYYIIDILPAGAHYNVYEFVKDFEKARQEILSHGNVPVLCGGTGLYINAVTSAYDFKEKIPLSSIRNDLASLKTFFIGTLVTRELRNARIDARLDARLNEGMVEEIRGLLDSGVPAQSLLAYGLEYKYVTLYILGELDYSQMREKLSVAIHQFAKRQMTWFRGMERSGVKIHWVEQ